MNENNKELTAIDCSGNPVESLRYMFVEVAQGGTIARGANPVERPVFQMQHGACRGIFRVREDLPIELKVGLFGGSEFDTWVRFSSDTGAARDFKATVGIAMKLFNVPGAAPGGAPGEPATFDILLQNHDVFFVDTAKEFCEFTQAGVINGDYDSYLKAHPQTAAILDEMEKPVSSVLGITYWSCLPFAFGPERYVKYRLEPLEQEIPPSGEPANPRQLKTNLEAAMRTSGGRFRFLIQLQTDAATMPLDRATVRWDETISPFIHVADLILPPQDIAARGQAEYGSNLAFNIWQVTGDHTPQGTIAEARRVVYSASARQRHTMNGVPHGEPAEPRPLAAGPAAIDRRIVGAKIHPAIGIARVGDSAEGFFIGPETTTLPERDRNFYRDEHGALKRQAARFRVFGYNAAGTVVRELTADNAEVEWTVHVANRKAAWYRFIAALDISDAAQLECPRRNAGVSGTNRSTLVIDPGSRSVSGRSQGGEDRFRFDTGKFKDTVVPLGEIRTDEKGRLVFLGGRGVAASPSGSPIFTETDENTFNNADDWFDDMSDGPVTATVMVDGAAVPVEGAWVVVAPPNYAPDIVGWRTMYDLMIEVFTSAGELSMPNDVSFMRDVLPQLQRLSGLQWVNKGFAAMFGAGAPFDFFSPHLIDRLATKYTGKPDDDPNQELRRTIYNAFRSLSATSDEPSLWPPIYGDAEGSFSPDSPRNSLMLPGYQAAILRAWVGGRFTDDRAGFTPVPEDVDRVPIVDRPAMLDRTALTYCLADAFHPGCEMTWPMRHATMYAAPFRIRHRDPDLRTPDYGGKLTKEIALRADGPLNAQGPGDITKWMAVPWHGDTAGCRSGYDKQYDPFLPTFWPARVPNQVITEDDYELVTNEALPRAERLVAFNRRMDWEFPALQGDSFAEVANDMVKKFGALGVLEKRAGPANDPDIPAILFVSNVSEAQKKIMAEFAFALEDRAARTTKATQEAGWLSDEQHASFVRARYPNRSRRRE
ncbi:LodA/GoxA family CTQ-dependent oxidase (plasmid) [Rhizobium leguminosarum]